MYDLLGAKEVADLLGVSERTVVRMFQSGELPAMQLNGKTWRIRRTTVEAYLDRGLGPPEPKAPQAMLRRVA